MRRQLHQNCDSVYTETDPTQPLRSTRGRRSRGKACGGSKPLGLKERRCDGDAVLVPDLPERALMQFILRLREQEGLTWREITARVELRVAQRAGRKPRPWAKYEHSESGIKRRYAREKELQVEAKRQERKYRELHGLRDEEPTPGY